MLLLQCDGWLQDEVCFLNGEEQQEAMKLTISGTVISDCSSMEQTVHFFVLSATSRCAEMEVCYNVWGFELLGVNRLLY